MRTFRLWLRISLLLIVAGLIAGGVVLNRALRQRIYREVNENLEAIAQLKVSQITDWRTARQDEASVMTQGPGFVRIVTHWSDRSRADVESLLFRFSVTKKNFRLNNVLLASETGEVYLSLDDKTGNLHETTRRALDTAFRTQKPVLSDLYLPPGESQPQMDVIAPFFIRQGNSAVPANAIMCRYDVRQYLYPIIKTWPVPSHSAETLLVRRDGDSVIYLNDLRHNHQKAFSLRLPLSRTDLPAAMAVLGKRGLVQGRDYRGVKVLAVLKEVPGTLWFLIAKVDEEEALSSLRRESALILGLVGFLVISVTAVTGVLWQRNAKAHYRALFEAENAQREIEARYRRSLDGIAEGCQILDFDWRILYINAAALRYCGRTEKELLGHTLMEVCPGIESSADYAAYARCMSQRTPQTLESSLDLPDGKKWIEFSIHPIPEGIFVLSTDVTARKRSEEILRESEARYRTLFEHMTQGVFRLKANRELIDVNPSALKMLGLTRDEFVSRLSGDPSLDPIHEDGSPILDQERPPVVALKTGKPAVTVMGLLHPKTRQRIWIAADATPEFTEGEDTPSHVLVTFYDITDRKNAEAERSLLASAIDQTSDAVVITDTKGIVQYVNPVFEVVTGKAREEAVGQPMPRENVDSQDDAFFSGFWNTLSSGKTWRGRLTNRSKDGALYTEEVTASPVFNSAGAIVNYISVGRNITDILKLQQDKEKLQEQILQAQKMESVGRLAGGVAHDFNNMLSVILGHTQLSLDTIDASHPLYAHLQEIHQAALRSADLTRQLLAFARKQTVTPKVLDLNQTIGGLLDMLKRLIGENIHLDWQPGRDLWPVRIDPAQVTQILTNLAVNSRDAIDAAGRITIATENRTIDERFCSSRPGFIAGDYVVLSASDNGRGIDKEALDHLFEPFFTTKKLGEGTGLGLATVYGIVSQNEGFIQVDSEPGKGAAFQIYFPRFASRPADVKKENPAGAPEGGKETILLAEDEVAVQKLTRTLLEHLGYTVIAASTPSEAIRLTEGYAGDIHLLLADVVMPEMTGRDLAERLHRLRPNLKRLFMSGYTADVIAHHGIVEEGVHFIQKPFSRKTLAAKVREALES